MAKPTNRGAALPPPTVPAPVAPAPAFDDADNVKEVPKVKKAKGGIQVKALREGFMNGVRIKRDDIFMVETPEELGSWMECTDAAQQAAHKARLEAKKAKNLKLTQEKKERE